MSSDQNRVRGGDGRFVARGDGGELDSDDGGETGSVGVQGEVVPQPTEEERQRWREEGEEFQAQIAARLEQLESEQEGIRSGFEGLSCEVKALAEKL